MPITSTNATRYAADPASVDAQWSAFFKAPRDTETDTTCERPPCQERAGRKTDVSDAGWLRQLHSYGLLRASFCAEIGSMGRDGAAAVVCP